MFRLPYHSLNLFFLLAALALVAGCSVGKGGGVYGGINNSTKQYSLQDKITSSGNGRYSQRVDGLPAQPKDVSLVPDAEPMPEPPSKQGNASSYVVFGKTYRVLNSSRGFSQTGTASWYGNKFHGHLTSNGEIYDMYAMSAAHTSLPLPTYLEVTNLDNQRRVIVRVNDRGPFVGKRIIDLSYAAAAKLDMLQTGTARVRVTAIDPVQWQAQQARKAKLANNAPVNSNNQVYLQVAALGDAQAAMQLRHKLTSLTSAPVRIVQPTNASAFYRVQVGPLAQHAVEPTIQQLEATNLGRPLLVQN